MIITWIIGIVLSFIAIRLLKGSRYVEREKTWEKPYRPEGPVLRVWSLILYILGGLIPIGNIIMAIIVIVFWAISVYGDKDWKYTRSAWFISLLNKPIK